MLFAFKDQRLRAVLAMRNQAPGAHPLEHIAQAHREDDDEMIKAAHDCTARGSDFKQIVVAYVSRG